MPLTLWLPLALAVVAGLSAGRVQRCLPPRLSAPVLTVVAAGSALAVAWGLGIAIFGYIVQIPLVAEWGGWCDRVLPSDHRVAAPIGLLSLAALALAGGRAWRWHRHVQRLMAVMAFHDGSLEVVPMAEPAAFAVPGNPGHIVVSQAMLDCLDETELRVLLAHEQAHLDLHHHRYVRLADLAGVAIPFLRPIAGHVRFATERWADEVAVDAIGDRSVVARAIARAALAMTATPPPLALGIDGEIVARVEALLDTRRSSAWLINGSAAALGVTVLVVLASSTLQLHHLLAFAAHVCRL